MLHDSVCCFALLERARVCKTALKAWRFKEIRKTAFNYMHSTRVSDVRQLYLVAGGFTTIRWYYSLVRSTKYVFASWSNQNVELTAPAHWRTHRWLLYKLLLHRRGKQRGHIYHFRLMNYVMDMIQLQMLHWNSFKTINHWQNIIVKNHMYLKNTLSVMVIRLRNTV